ncbi:MAG: 4Fe-4S dicluster domain-containing protein [Candidatus Bathyarchaeota archaeon]|nr:4Fe-4S dicluster domain-containing protein [Candidatus Termiticorpusculum sp.]
MPYKSSKQDLLDVLVLEWALQVKNYRLTLDRRRCVGCQICSLACSKGAITVEKTSKSADRALKPLVDIDLDRCNFCGVCDVTCLYGAINVTVNGTRNMALILNESYPKISRVITLDTKLCLKDCFECENVCPWQLIKVSHVGFDGQPVQNVNLLSPTAKRRVRVSVDIQENYCPTCKICEVKCPSKTLKVRKIFEGKILINTDKCPSDCHDCVDVCPVPNVLTVNTARKVDIAELYCTYCGACKNVCPVPEALMVRRTKVAHTRVHSGAWNKALEKLTSKQAGVKELKAVTSLKKRNVIIKRLRDEIDR